LVGSGKHRERLQPLRVLGDDDIGCSESREEGNTRYAFIGAPMGTRGSFTQGLPAHAAHRSNSVGSPLLPAGQTIGLSSRHRKVRHVAREGRCGEERQTAWLFGSSACHASGAPGGANVDRGDSLARKRIDGSRACPRVGIVLQRSVVEVAAQRSAKATHSPSGCRSSRGRELISRWQSRTLVHRKMYERPERFERQGDDSSDQPTPIGGARRMIPDGEQLGSMTRWIAPAGITEGRHLGSLRGRHPSRGGGSTRVSASMWSS